MNAVATVFILNLKISSNLDLNAHVLRKMALLSFCTLESLSIMRIGADIKQMREKVRSFRSKLGNTQYGNTGCGVFNQGVQN